MLSLSRSLGRSLSLSLSLARSLARSLDRSLCSKDIPRALGTYNIDIILYMSDIGDGRELFDEWAIIRHTPLPQTLAANQRAISTLLFLLVGIQNIGTIRDKEIK